MSDFKAMILDRLIELLGTEPPQDAGHHPSVELHERVGAAWAEWDKQVSAYRLLLGVQLVNDAIAQHRKEPTSEQPDPECAPVCRHAAEL